MQKFKQYAIGCFYGWSQTVIYVGVVDEQKRLVVEKEIVRRSASVSAIAETLKGLKHPIWINLHEPLAKELRGSRVEQLDIRGQQQHELESLSDLFESLKSEGRIILEESISSPEGEVKQNAFKLMLKGLTPALCGNPPVLARGMAIVIKRPPISQYPRYYW